MTITPIIDRALAEGWIWIRQLGCGLPESGAVCLESSEILDRIADAMAANVAHSHWEGKAAIRSGRQGRTQWNAVVDLEEIDRLVAREIQNQANGVAVARNTLYRTQADLGIAKGAAETLYNSGLALAATSCEVAAAKQATSAVHAALTALADTTERHTKVVSSLNSSLTLLLAQLSKGGRQTRFGTAPASDLASANALRNSADILRVNVAALMEESAASYVTTRWLAEPAAVVAGIGQRVWETHGRYTAAFNRQLEIFEIRRVAVIQKLRQDVENRAATLAAIATRFAMTDEEALWLAYTLDIV